MRTVRHDDGSEYLLVERSATTSRVRDPSTGAEQYVPNDELEPAGERPLAVAARAVPAPVRNAVRAAHDDVALGLLVEIGRREEAPVRTLLDATECCESDLHGRLAEFVAAGLIEEYEVGGERGYQLTDDGRTALDALGAALPDEKR